MPRAERYETARISVYAHFIRWWQAMRVLGAEVLSWKERLCLRRRGSVLGAEVLFWEVDRALSRWMVERGGNSLDF